MVCGLSGGVDSTVAAVLIHRAIGDRLTCIFVDNGVMRQDEAAADSTRFERLKLPLCSPTPRPVPRAAGRHHRSGAEAQDHRRDVHRRVRGRGGEARVVRLPGTGHAVSGRDRKRLGDRPVARDQEPSQRRRPAGTDAVQAGRAAAHAVQGRSPRGRQGAGPGRRVRVAAAVPGPRARGADPRRGERVAAQSGPPRRSHRLRRSEDARAGTARCGSRSRCCCRCRASA